MQRLYQKLDVSDRGAAVAEAVHRFSGGATLILRPAFFLIPIAIAFKGIPWITGILGSVRSIAYLVIWLTHPGILDVSSKVDSRLAGLRVPGVWLTAATTGLSYALFEEVPADRCASRRPNDNSSPSRWLPPDRERAVVAEALHDRPLQMPLATRTDLEDAMDDPPASILDPVMANLRTIATQLRELVSWLHP